MMMRLQHKRPDGEIDTYHLKPGRRYHLGRGSACEIRILDLKLSRKHCVIEFADGLWRVEDLCSTNGCKLDGEQIVGTMPLRQGARIEAGTSAVTIAAVLTDAECDQLADEAEEEGAAATVPAPAPRASVPASAADRPAVPQQEPLPEGVEARDAEAHLNASEWEPEPAAEEHVATGALQPLPARTKPQPVLAAPSAAPPTPSVASARMAPLTLAPAESALAPRSPQPAIAAAAAAAAAPERPVPKIKPVTIRVGRIDGPEPHAPEPGAVPATPAAEPAAAVAAEPARVGTEPVVKVGAVGQPGTDREERTFFITVLGRRIGPLSRATARDLKARELKGVLTTADLEGYPLAQG